MSSLICIYHADHCKQLDGTGLIWNLLFVHCLSVDQHIFSQCVRSKVGRVRQWHLSENHVQLSSSSSWKCTRDLEVVEVHGTWPSKTWATKPHCLGGGIRMPSSMSWQMFIRSLSKVIKCSLQSFHEIDNIFIKLVEPETRTYLSWQLWPQGNGALQGSWHAGQAP